MIHKHGADYLHENFPKLDYLLHCETVVTEIDVTQLAGYQPPRERTGQGRGHGRDQTRSGNNQSPP